MSSARKIQLVIGTIGIILPLVTLFIPFYETVIMQGNPTKFPGLLYIYDPGEFDIGVISGIRSMYAWVNIPFCLALSILMMLNKPNLALSISLGGLLIPCNFLVFIGCSAGFGKPFGDTMLYGYWILLYTEIILVALSIYMALKNKMSRQKSDMDF